MRGPRTCPSTTVRARLDHPRHGHPVRPDGCPRTSALGDPGREEYRRGLDPLPPEHGASSSSSPGTAARINQAGRPGQGPFRSRRSRRSRMVPSTHGSAQGRNQVIVDPGPSPPCGARSADRRQPRGDPRRGPRSTTQTGGSVVALRGDGRLRGLPPSAGATPATGLTAAPTDPDAEPRHRLPKALPDCRRLRPRPRTTIALGFNAASLAVNRIVDRLPPRGPGALLPRAATAPADKRETQTPTRPRPPPSTASWAARPGRVHRPAGEPLPPDPGRPVSRAKQTNRAMPSRTQAAHAC